MLPAWLIGCLVYAIWFAGTAHSHSSSRIWGSNYVAKLAEAMCRAVGNWMGLTFSVVYDGANPDVSRTCVVAASPHGAFPLAQIGLGMMSFRVTPPKGISQYLIGGASVLFYIPILREFLMLGGVRHVSRKTLQAFLRRGITVGLNPGGNWEVSWGHSWIERVTYLYDAHRHPLCQPNRLMLAPTRSTHIHSPTW